MASGVNVSISITQNSQNIANNTSSITVKVTVGTYGNSFNLNGMPVKVVLSGSYSGTYNTSVALNKSQTKTAFNRTFTVNHSATGTAKVTAKVTVQTNISAGTITKSTTKTLTTIPRASTPSATGTPQLGNPITIKTNRKSTAFTHTIAWNWAGKSGTIATGVEDSVTWTPAIATFAPYLTSATSSTCTITCTTYSGGSNIGSKTCSFTLSIPASVVPSCALAVTDMAGYLDTYGAYVLNKSQVQATITAAGIYGSTITERKAVLDNTSKSGTASVIDLGAPTLTGTRTVTATAKDSRGRTASDSEQITVANYTSPTLTATAYRATNGLEDDESTTVRINIAGAVCDVNNSGINTGTVTIESRPVNGEWTQRQSQDRGSTFDFFEDLTGFEATSRYEIRVTVTDDFDTIAQMTLFIMTAQPVMDLHSTGEGIGFATTAQQGQFRVGIPSVFMDKVVFENNGVSGGEIRNKGNSLTIGTSIAVENYLDATTPTAGGFRIAADDGILLMSNLAAGYEERKTLGFSANGNLLPASHIYMPNDGAIASYNAAASNVISMLRLNASDQVELNWTTGGIKGRMCKKLWSGAWSEGGTITVPEYQYYRFFFLEHNYANCPIYAVRMSLSSSGLVGVNGYATSGGVNMTFMAVQALQPSSTTLKMTAAFRLTLNGSTGATSHEDITIDAIYGVL